MRPAEIESRLQQVFAACALATLVLLGVFLKTRLSAQTPGFNPEDDTGYYSAESALQYRYAAMIARGQPIPEIDRDAQFPEGVRTNVELTLLMERAAGWSYRLIPERVRPSDFRWFTILWVALVSSLSIPALYALSLRLSGSRALALAVAAVYGVSWASSGNAIGTFDHESFAFPLIAAGLACLAAALDRREKRPRFFAFASGLALAAALMSWHFTRFYLASLLLAALWTHWRHRADLEAARRLRLAFLFLGAAALAAWILDPAMRSNSGIHEASAYGHVYALLFAKLRNGLLKPFDPLRLTQEARLLWQGPFNSPEPGFVVFALLPLVFIGLPRLWASIKGEAPPSVAGTLADAMLILYTLGALMVSRLLPMFSFFFCAAAARLPDRLSRKKMLIAGFTLIACAEAVKSIAPASRLNPFLALSSRLETADGRPPASVGAEREAIRWLRRNGEGKSVLADFGISPAFLVYAGAPILLQPKFESGATREKTAEFLKALYSDEETFFSFCRKYQAGLFVYTTDDVLDATGDGPRYMSGTPGFKPDMAAVLFQFRPDALKHFRLAYQNGDYRIFAVGEKPREKADPEADLVYDIRQFHPEPLPDGALRLDVAGAVARLRESRDKLRLARLLARLGFRDASRQAYADAYAAWPERATKAEAKRTAGL